MHPVLADSLICCDFIEKKIVVCYLLLYMAIGVQIRESKFVDVVTFCNEGFSCQCP